MTQKALLLLNHRIYSAFQLWVGTWYLANKWLVYGSWWISLLAWSSWELTLLRERAVRLTVTCSQMNAPLEQLRSIKGPQCACSIRRDVGQGLCMLETFPSRCYGAPLASGQVLESADACLFMSFPNFSREELASNLSQGLIDMFVEWRKRFYFCQITLFIVFISFAWARHIWPVND